MSPHVHIDRDAVSAFCRRHNIKRLALFGSVLREDFGPDSDIDVLVEFQPGHVPGFNFFSIERELSGLLHGRRVDMVTSKFLSPRIRDHVLSSAEPVFDCDMSLLAHPPRAVAPVRVLPIPLRERHIPAPGRLVVKHDPATAFG